MLKILNTDQELEAIITDYWSDDITEEINKNFTLKFTAVVDEKADHLINDNLVEVEDNLFRIRYYETDLNNNGNIINVFAEHVSYDLIDDDMEWFTSHGTPTAILTELFQGTPFTVGTVDFSEVTLFSIQEPTNKRAILVQFANALGGELKFDRFEISLLNQRGSENGVQFREAKNIRGIKVMKDKRSGTEQTAYSVDLVELRSLPEYGDLEAVGLGDVIRVISPSTSTDVEQRIVKYSYSPKQRINSSVDIANFVEGIEDTITNIKKETVYKDRVYNGVRVGPEVGFESVRSDKLTRNVSNATEGTRIQKGDGSRGNWIDVFYADLEGNLTLAGKIFASGGSIAGWAIEPDRLEGNGAIVGGSITGALIQTNPGLFPRIELSSTNNLLTAYSSPNSTVRINTTSAVADLIFSDGGFSTYLFQTGNSFDIIAQNSNFSLIAGNISLNPSGEIIIESFAKIRGVINGQTLQQALNSLSLRISALENA